MPLFRRAAHTVRLASTVASPRPAYAAGFRASIATIIPLAASEIFSLGTAGTWMSLAGFNGALSDRGGSYGIRAKMMTAMLLTGAVAATLGALVSGHLVLALAATFTIALVASLLRVWGAPGLSVGSAMLSVYVISLAVPRTSADDPFVRAGYVVLGGLWAMGIALVLWPLRPYRPARLAVADSFNALADYVDEVAGTSLSPTTAEWPVQHTPGKTTNVRTALENARMVLVQLRRGRPAKVDRGERLLVLNETADQLFGYIAALGETLRSLKGASRSDPLHEQSVELLRDVASTCRVIAATVIIETRTSPIAVPWSGDGLRALMRSAPEATMDIQYEQVALIFDRAAQFASSASVTLEELNGGRARGAAAAAPTIRAPAAEDLQDGVSPWDALRGVVSPSSLLMQFALRVAVVMTIAVALTETLAIKRGYWITITVIVILQPYTGVTLTRAVQRVAGTVLGGLLAVALAAVFHDPRAVLVIATVFVACCVALMPVNYAAYSIFLTPTFVLLAEASAGDWHLAGTRVANTLIGGALALAGSRLLWPSPERSRFPSYASAALRANGAYLDCAIERYDDRSDAAGESLRAARRAIGLATVNAEESLQRALAEAHGDERRLAPALSFLAYTRRFTASVAALAVARHLEDGSGRDGLEPFRRIAVAAFEDLASALDENRAPVALPASSRAIEQAPLSPLARARVDRMARQLKTLHDAVARMAEPIVQG